MSTPSLNKMYAEAKQLANQKKCATIRLGYGTIMMQLPFLVDFAIATEPPNSSSKLDHLCIMPGPNAQSRVSAH